MTIVCASAMTMMQAAPSAMMYINNRICRRRGGMRLRAIRFTRRINTRRFRSRAESKTCWPMSTHDAESRERSACAFEPAGRRTTDRGPTAANLAHVDALIQPRGIVVFMNLSGANQLGIFLASLLRTRDDGERRDSQKANSNLSQTSSPGGESSILHGIFVR
jgi:hypothetical protein